MTFLKKIKEENNTPKYLYLDQNILIYFAKTYYEKTNSLIKEILEKLYKLVNEGTLIVVFNLTNVIEAQKVNDDDRLRRFAEFVVSLTKGNAFVPFPYLEIFEVENVIRIELNRNIIDIRERAIGKGVFYLIHDGNPPRITSTEPISEDSQRVIASKLREHFSTEETIIEYFLNRTHQNGNTIKTIQELEDIRQKGYNIKDKKYKQKLGIAQFIVNMIVEKIAIVCKVYNVHPRILRLSEGMDRIVEVIQNMPLMYTYHLLLQGLDEIPDHPITPNDLVDINSFCFALPYCDIVVGEKYIISLARRKKIDKIYNTQLFNKGELDKFLDALKKLE